MKAVRFTVELSKLFVEGARLIGGNPAGVGLIDGFRVALMYLGEIVEIAEREQNVPILLRLYALGLIENPVPGLKTEGLWLPEYDAYAISINAAREWEEEYEVTAVNGLSDADKGEA